MRKYFVIMAAIAVALLAVSCNKEQNTPDEPQQTVAGEQITITASIPAELSKVDLAYTGTALHPTWAAGDKIRVADHSNSSNYQEFTLTAGEGTQSGTFSGTAISATSYDITIVNAKSWPANVLAQTQAEDESTAHLGYTVALTGVNTYEDIAFTSAWASSKGGTIAQSGALHLQVTLPSGAAAKVNNVTMVADKNIFGATGTMSIAITTPGDNGTANTLDVYASIPPTGVNIPAGTGLLFKFGTNDADHSVYTRYYLTSGALNLAGGQLNLISLTGTNTDKYAGKDDDGTAAHPYLIADKYQMLAMNDLMVAGATKYFKLVADIDLADVSWTPLNGSPYTKAINIDGNSKKISNLATSLFDDLNGTVNNLTLYHSIVSSAETVGILANTCNTAASTVTGVTINGTSTLTCTATADRKYVGGLVGEVSTASSFNDCHIVGLTVTSPTSDYTYSGVAFGYVHNDSASIGGTNKCTLESCTLTAGNYASGFISVMDGGTVSNNEVNCTVNGGSTISTFVAKITAGSLTNNSVTGSVSGKQSIGGLVGNLSGGALSGNTTSVTITGANYYCGGIVGMMQGGSVENCHASGNVTANSVKYVHSGGLIGRIEGSITVSVSNCSASGDVEAKGAYAGGLVGIIASGPTVTIEKCYATGDVTTENGTYNKWAGGLIGTIDGNTVTVSVNDCYSTGTVTGASTCGGLVGYNKSATLNVSRGYTSSSFPATSSGPLLGQNAGTTTCTSFVAWSSAGALVGSGTAVSDSGNYLGTTGTILSQAQAFTAPNNWDFTTVWNEVNPPTLH